MMKSSQTTKGYSNKVKRIKNGKENLCLISSLHVCVCVCVFVCCMQILTDGTNERCDTTVPVGTVYVVCAARGRGYIK